MKLFGWVIGKSRRASGDASKTGQKGRGKTAKERYLDYLENHNLPKWLVAMERESGLDFPASDPLTAYLDMHDRLDKHGLLPNKDGKDSVDKLVDALPELAKALTPLFGPLMAAKMGVDPSVYREPAQLEAPAPPNTPATPNPEPPAVRRKEKTAVPPVKIPTKLATTIAMTVMDQLEPPQAAAWLMSQQNEMVDALIAEVRRTKDAELIAGLDALAADNPDMVEVVAWLHKKGEWTVQVARAIRRAGIHAVDNGKPRRVKTL